MSRRIPWKVPVRTPLPFVSSAFVGVGGFAPQATDWIKHNAVLSDCVRQPWPVVLMDRADRWPLVYYLAWYLPAALVGKVAGYAAAQVALWVWTSLGVMLAGGWFARLTRLPVDLLAVSGGWNPAVALLSHLGERPAWDETLAFFERYLAS